MNGVGAHEVIVETPEHSLSLAMLPERVVEDVLWAYRDRMLDLKNDKRFRYVLIFKNHGEAAGATVEGLDVLQFMAKAQVAGVELVVRQGVEHEGVVGIGAVADGDQAGHGSLRETASGEVAILPTVTPRRG